jgi:septum formation protein
VVLGSASPYKQALLRSAGYIFTVAAADITEDQFIQPTVAETVRIIAEEKARALLPRYVASDTVIITTDVVGELDGHYLGKPASLEQAQQWLLSYAGRTVRIWCATSLADARTGQIITDIRWVDVVFGNISAEQIGQYLRETSPLDKGGALAIEEAERRGWVKLITGEYAAIIGLSVDFIRQQLPSLANSA